MAASSDPLPWYHLLRLSGVSCSDHICLDSCFGFPSSLSSANIYFSQGSISDLSGWLIWPVPVTACWPYIVPACPAPGVSCGFPTVVSASLGLSPLASLEALSQSSFLCCPVGATATLDSWPLTSSFPRAFRAFGLGSGTPLCSPTSCSPQLAGFGFLSLLI